MNANQGRRQIHLGLFAFPGGNHAAGWRHPEADILTATLADVTRIAQIAERGTFDMMFIADTPAFSPTMAPTKVSVLDPLILLSSVSAATSRIGLAGTVSTTYADPYTTARQLLSLDHVSGGRAAWNIVTTGIASAAANFSKAEHPTHENRYARAAEFVHVVQGLWKSLAPDALRIDRATGIYYETLAVRSLDHKGRYFQVAGPLNLLPSPQGHPLLVQAGASGPGRDLAAGVADIIYTIQQDIDVARAFRTDVRRRTALAGRDPGKIFVLPGIMPVLGATEAEAKTRYAGLMERPDSRSVQDWLSERFGLDLSGIGLDDPFPKIDLSNFRGNRSRAEMLQALAQRQALSLGEVLHIDRGSRGNKVIVGTPDQVADTLIAWFETGAADGFNIMPAYFVAQLDAFVDEVIPLLRKAGLFRDAYDATTLRGHFGLAVA